MTDSANRPPASSASAPPPAANRLNPALLVFLIFPLAGLVAALALGAERSATNGALFPPDSVYRPNTLVNKAAPDFTLVTLGNKPLALSALRGRVVFLNFWATWCAPCRQEMPAFQQLIDGKIQAPAGVLATVLAVDQGETPDQVRAFYTELTLSVPVVMDRSQAISDEYQLVNLPHTFVIDTAGIVRYDHIGVMTADDLARYLQKLAATAYF